MKIKLSSSLRIIISLLVISSLLFQDTFFISNQLEAQVNATPLTEEAVSANLSVPDPEEGVIAVLVDENNLKKEQVSELIKTYADTLSKKLPQTKSIIITLSREEKPVKILSLLETIYREEGLTGIIVIGEVPIPMLTKDNVTFPSLFPYIDFDSKLWIYDEKPGAEKFVLNDFSDNSEPEIFAGLIKPPSPVDSSEYDSSLALYLTKIINYHNGANPAEKKISFLDTINRPILGEASGTNKDYIDQTITAILQMGRYDLNFYELTRVEKDKLEDCGKGFIPATIKVVKAISKIRPWKPETLKYLLTPLIYIPPIPLSQEEPEKITLPTVPDLSSFADFSTKINCVSKLPDPSLLSSLQDTLPTISKLTEINPTNLLNLKDAIPTNPLPDVSQFQEITEKITNFTANKNSKGIVNKAYAGLENLDLLKDSLSDLQNISLPDPAVLDQIITELKTGIPGAPTLPTQNLNLPNLDSLNALDISKVTQFLDQAKKLQEMEMPNLEDYKLETLIGDNLDITSFSDKLTEVASQIAIPEVPPEIQNIIEQGIPDIGGALDNLGFNPEELVIDIPEDQGFASKNFIPRSGAKLEIPTFDLKPLTPTLSVLNSLPPLPKMPDLPKFSWTIEVPPPFVPIVLPGLPTPPALNLMDDFYILPLDMITPPSPIPPAGFMSRVKAMLKIPDFPEIPEIPKAPNLDKEIALLESFCQMPDFSLIQEIANSSFLKDLQDTATLTSKTSGNTQVAYAGLTNLDQLVELTNLVEKPEFEIIKNLTEVDLEGFNSELEKITEIMNLVKNPEESGLNELNKLKDSIGTIDTNALTEQFTNFKASQLNPDTLSTLKQTLLPNLEKLQSLSSVLNPGAVLGASIDRSKSTEPGKVLGISTINYTEKIDQLKSSLGDIDKVKDSLGGVEKMLEPITNLQGQIGALTSIIDISDKLTAVNDIIAQVKQIGDITAPIADFQKNLADVMPEQAKKNLESLKNIGKIPEPDLMSLISINVTGYTPPTEIKLPKFDNIKDPTEITGDTSKTILNQDIYKNLLSPSKKAWEILCESNGSTFDDLDKLLRDLSYYNETDIKDIDREAKTYPREYMETFFNNLITKPDPSLNKKYFLENLVPGKTEIALLNAKGEPNKIDLAGSFLEGKDISSPNSLVSLLNGGPFGDFTKADYIGGHQLFKGDTLSVISFTAINPGNTDTPIDIGSSQSFGYGLFNDAPFLSTFADGNVTLGDSFKPAQKESQIILGDPTVMLSAQEKNNDNDYSITFGETISHYSRGKNLILSADFNSDQKNDLISINSLNGEIQFYRGAPSSARERFLNEGTIFQVQLPEVDIAKIEELTNQEAEEKNATVDKEQELARQKAEIIAQEKQSGVLTEDEKKNIAKKKTDIASQEKENKSLTENTEQILAEKRTELSSTKILKAETGDFNGDSIADLSIHYLVPGDPPKEEVKVLINDGISNFTENDTFPFDEAKIISKSDAVIPENIIAYQFGESPFSTETRFKTSTNDFDGDADLDLVFSTGKQLQFKENLKNGKQVRKKLSKPHVVRESTNLESINKPIDTKEIVPNEGYSEISWYPSYLKDLAGYNVYFSQNNRFLFDKKNIVPLASLNNVLSPSFKLYNLENDKRVYVTITAFTSDGKETTISQVLQTTPRVKADTEVPIAIIKAKNDVLINSLNDFDGSGSLENSKHLTYSWDFDLATDSDSDGDTKNDQESTEEKPKHIYDVLGKYTIGLKIEDKNGNKAETTHDIEVSLPRDLVITLEDGLVLFLNEMSPNLEVSYYKIPAGKEDYDHTELKKKTTDANGFVSFAPVINVPGSKIISKETGETMILINTKKELLTTNFTKKIETTFSQTQIKIADDSTEIAKIFFVHDRNQDASIVDSLSDILINADVNSGVFVEDINKGDSFDLSIGDNGSIRLTENKDTVEKTYATILPSGGLYLDNSAYLELEKNEKNEFIFNILLAGNESPLAKILLKPLSGKTTIQETKNDLEINPGIYITYNDDLADFENTQDLGPGDRLFAIVRDKVGNESPKTNIITLRKFHTTKEFLDIIETETPANPETEILSEATKEDQTGTITDSGKVLGVSTSRLNKYQQATNLNQENIDVLSDSSPTLFGRVNRYNTDINLVINNDISEKNIVKTKIKADRTGNYEYALTRILEEGTYRVTISDQNNQILSVKKIEIDLTPPEMPLVEAFDGETKVAGITSPNSIILAYNFNEVFDPITTVSSDTNGKFLINFPTRTSHFTLFAKDQAGNKSEVKEVFYNPKGLMEQKETQAIQNISNELQNEQAKKSTKNPERFIGLFILCLGIASFIYSKRDQLFPAKY
jgi:hypothetical protein